MDMDAVIQFGVLIGIVVLAFLGLILVCMGAEKLLEKIFKMIVSLETGSVSPFSLARIYLIGIFVDFMIFLKIKDVENIPLYLLIAVVINCFLLYVNEKNKKKYGKRNMLCGVGIFLVAPILCIVITICLMLSMFISGNATQTTRTSGGGGGTPSDKTPRFEEKYDPVYGKYYSDGNGNMKDANGKDVNPWDKPYWMP